MAPARLLPLLGTVAVLYLIALATQLAGSGTSYATQAAVAALITLTVLLPALAPRDGRDVRATVLVRWLGVLGGLAGTGMLVDPGLVSAIDAVSATAACAFGAQLVTIALEVPDRPRAYQRARWLGALPWVLALGPLAVSLVSSFGPLELGFVEPIVLNDRATLAPPIFAALCAVPALLLHLGRGRVGSDPEARATSGWLAATLALGLAGILGVAWLRALHLAGPSFAAPTITLLLLLVIVGHVRALDPALARLAAPAVRRGLAVLSIGVATFGATLLARRAGLLPVPDGWRALDIALAGGGVAVACSALAGPVTRLFDRWIAPFEGQLLAALASVEEELPGQGGLEGIARVVLRALRRSAGDVGAAPWLWTVAPDHELGLDAAGEPHATGRAMPAELRDAFEDKLLGRSTLPEEVFRHGILLRWQLERDAVRLADLRPLAAALEELDAAAVVPLVVEGMLEGALVLPRGLRASPLSFEEVEALERLGRRVCPLLATLAAEERANLRAAEAARRVEELEEAVGLRTDELEAVLGELRRLRAGRVVLEEVELERGSPAAYGRAMREVLERLRALAPLDAPLALVDEPGCGTVRLARRLHEEGGRADEPFVVVDVAATPAERTHALLAGERREGAPEQPGWLELAAGGTLVLENPAALSPDAQAALLEALAHREVRSVGGIGVMPVRARVVVILRAEAWIGLHPELAERLAGAVVRVPPLRERPEDLPALVLMALDRAVRLLGREPAGVDEEALELLRAYAWPGNLVELARVVERAVATAAGVRLTADEIRAAIGSVPAPDELGLDVEAELGETASPAAPPPAATPAEASSAPLLEGTYEELERRILAEALWRAAGNKSEAARALGLKRTTFQDKLRRYGLLGIEPREPSVAGARRSDPPN